MKMKFTVCAFLLATAATQAAQTYEPEVGDILFQSLPENEVIANIYCSELIFKAYKKSSGQALGHTCRLADLNWRPYARTIMAITGGRIPIAREMITPRDMARAWQLELVRPMEDHRAKKRP